MAYSNEVGSLQRRLDSLAGDLLEARRGAETMQQIGDTMRRLQAEFAQLQTTSRANSPVRQSMAPSSPQLWAESG